MWWTESAENISTREAIAILGDCSIGIGSWGTPWPDEELLAGYPELRLWVYAELR